MESTELTASLLNTNTNTNNNELDPTVLPNAVANMVTAVSTAARLSIRCSAFFLDTFFEVAKYGTSLSLGLSRNALKNALNTAKDLHNLSTGELPRLLEQEENNVFNKVLDTYTSFGLDLVNHTFSLSELFALSGLKFTSKTIKSTLKAAEESVRLVDGVFGANDTSRAIATFVSLLHRELVQDANFGLSKSGTVSIMYGMTKALTAYAILQNVTQKSFPRNYPSTIIWEGTVRKSLSANSVVDEANEFMRPRRKSEIANMTKKNDAQIIEELSAILADPYFKSNQPPVPVRSYSLQQLGSSQEESSTNQLITEALAEKRRTSQDDQSEIHSCSLSYHDTPHLSGLKRTHSSPQIAVEDQLDTIINNLTKHKSSSSVSDIPQPNHKHNCPTCQRNAARSKATNDLKNNEATSLHNEKLSVLHMTPNSPLPSTSQTPDDPLNSQQDALQQEISYYEQGWNFPRNHIIYNIAHFMRYASAAYGESFMRILGIGEIPSVLPEDTEHHRNHHAFAHHTGNSVDDILLSSYTETSPLQLNNPSIHALVHYVTVDHASEAIVLTCRGTLGLSDVLTDISMEYDDFYLPNEPDHPPMKAHRGMLAAAQLLAKEKGKVYQKVRQGLEDYPDYGLVICGHSLGGSVASLLCVLWSEKKEIEKEVVIPSTFADIDMPSFVTSPNSGLPAGRPIHCYSFGSAAVMSVEFSNYCAGLVTSVVNNYDVVSGLSLGTLKEFKNVATNLHADGDVAEQIIKRSIKKFRIGKNESSEEDDEWFLSIYKTIRADMKEEKMYPPGSVYLLECKNLADDEDDDEDLQRVILRRCDDIEARFSEVLFAKSMFINHSPVSYEKNIKKLCRGFYHVDYI
ncbi:hypothetical protein BDB01DRAFT_830875 [Pilobolus umbonatus]|nr:hypothetical protein BDB01DRAFT_830875 [Pilobolus umbonatus]